MRGANAATVGILAAALYDPLWTGAVHSSAAALVALVGVLLLMVGKRPAWLVVAFAGLAGTCLAS
jgi:chromate transporter